MTVSGRTAESSAVLSATTPLPVPSSLYDEALQARDIFRERTKEAAIAAIRFGLALRKLRAEYQGVGWQAWVASRFDYSIRTINRLISVANHFEDYIPILANPDSGNISLRVLYYLSMEKNDSIRADVMTSVGQGETLFPADVERRRNLAHLDDQNPSIAQLVRDDSITLKEGIKMAGAIKSLPDPVAATIVAHGVTNTELYPSLSRTFEARPDEFESIATTGHVTHELSSIPLNSASPTDLSLNAREFDTEAYLASLTNKEDYISGDRLKKNGSKIGRWVGDQAEIIRAASEILQPGKRYMVHVFELSS